MYQDHLFALSEDGDTFVMTLGEDFEVVGRNSLDEFSMSCPAITKDRLIVRTYNHVWCIKDGSTLAAGD